jgi:hypothetical protein
MSMLDTSTPVRAYWVKAEQMYVRVSRADQILSHQMYFPTRCDAKRFVLIYRYILEKAPLQIYSSALVFSPTRSAIRKRFLGQLPLVRYFTSR